MPLILQHRIYRRDLQANPHVLYVFGDNEARVGAGGQAGEMRGEPNAYGIPTLFAPGVPWNELDTENQNRILTEHFETVFDNIRVGHVVVFPLDGIGTGLAMLEDNAPSTFAHLQTLVAKLKEFQ